MGQISFKLSEDDMEFLKWYASENSSSVSSLYRDITLETYHQWRLSVLLDIYQKGSIGFKKMCRLAKISLTEGMIEIQKRQIEPPITDSMDEHTSSVRDKLIATMKENKL
jgi:hypothetical protein